MNLLTLCLKRPVLAVVINLIITLIGIVSFTKLNLRGIPNISPSVVGISTSYYGADAKFIEENITNVIEDELKGIKNLDFITSSSKDGQSDITIIFDLDANVETAINDVRAKVSNCTNSLPYDLKPPVISKLSRENYPQIWLAVSSDSYSDMELTDIVSQQIKPLLEQLSTVAQAKIYGSKDYSLIIEPNIENLYAAKITPDEIERAVNIQTKNYPLGSLNGPSKNIAFNLVNTTSTEKDFANIIIKNNQNGITKLGDIAKVYIAPHPNSENFMLSHNGNKAIVIGVIQQSSASIVDLSEQITQQLKIIKQKLPKNINIEIAHDSSIPVRQSLNNVFKTLIEAVFLVSIIIYLFLGRFKVSLVPLMTIPISLLGAFSLMYLRNFSINIFSLFAMVLAIGLVVDDAIVILENIHRKYEEGFSKIEAALKSIKETGFAIIAMTITLAAVFLPVGFISGFIGKIFIEFAWTLAFCVLVSGVVALTLTPVATSKLLHKNTSNNNFVIIYFHKLLKTLETSYLKYLNWCFEHKKTFWGFIILIILLTGVIMSLLKTTFAPQEDNGFLRIIYQGPNGTSTEYSFEAVKKAEKILDNNQNVKGYITFVNYNNGFTFVPLIDWKKRKILQSQIQGELLKQMFLIPEMSIYVLAPEMLLGSSQNDVEFNLETNENFEKLFKSNEIVTDAMAKSKIFSNINCDSSISTPTLKITVNKDLAYKNNLEINTIANTIKYFTTGKEIGLFRMNNKDYFCYLQFPKNQISTIQDLNKIYFKTYSMSPMEEPKMLPLANYVNFNYSASVPSYNHYNSMSNIKITADLNEGFSAKDAKKEITKIMEDHSYELDNIDLRFLGKIKQMDEANVNILYVFLLALLFIYLVLSAQFNSFKDSFLIMCAVPFSITGGVFLLLATSTSFNIYCGIGLVTLVGLVTKNSIMIVEFTNQLKESGLKLKESIIQATKLRLRPILMTSTATIIGVVPLLFTYGANSNASKSIGIVLIGGMLFGTIFTLFVIPLLYQTFYRSTK